MPREYARSYSPELVLNAGARDASEKIHTPIASATLPQPRSSCPSSRRR